MPCELKCIFSRQRRRAHKLLRHVLRLYRAQRDLLQPENDRELEGCIANLANALRQKAPDAAIDAAADQLDAAANRWLVDTSKDWLRELTEMLIIALVVVAATRVFFIQSARIPTGSMQPTLNGIRVVNLARDIRWKRPSTRWQMILELLVRGRAYYRVVAQDSGRITRIEPPEPIAPFLRLSGLGYKQRFLLGSTWHTIWFVPGDLPPVQGVPQAEVLFAHARIDKRRIYFKGDEIMNLAVIAGDRVLVDRVSYNFRRPRRGEIIVFTAKGIKQLVPDTYYLKRLVAMGGERVRIGNDRHVIVNGRRLDDRTPGFEKVYGAAGPPREDQYSGHVNDLVSQRYRNPPRLLASLFPDDQAEFVVRPGHLFVLGDNTLM
ncbi:MAG TPA: signal peptidase I, partial [Verrucomicrobiota bacterium]|nr:signal peptidase I [Verrucomicrobiota bacterium]